MVVNLILLEVQDRHESIISFFFLHKLTKYALVCIAIVVIAVPEALPMVVTICMASSIKSLGNKGNVVKHLELIEKMGKVTELCIDKTGMLTQNQMKVKGIFMGDRLQKELPIDSDNELLLESVLLNCFVRVEEKLGAEGQ